MRSERVYTYSRRYSSSSDPDEDDEIVPVVPVEESVLVSDEPGSDLDDVVLLVDDIDLDANEQAPSSDDSPDDNGSVDHQWDYCSCDECAAGLSDGKDDLEQQDVKQPEDPGPPEQFAGFEPHHAGAPKHFTGPWAPFRHGVNFVLLCVILSYGISRRAFTALRTIANTDWGHPSKWLSHKTLMARADNLPLLPMYVAEGRSEDGKMRKRPHHSLFDVIKRIIQFDDNWEHMVYKPSLGNPDSSELWYNPCTPSFDSRFLIT